MVSIHAPVKGATVGSVPFSSASTGFNPRPREGSDDTRGLRPRVSSVSIHAPVKGATFSDTIAERIIEVSIHAPVKGATLSDLEELR